MYLVCGEALFDFFSENDASGMASKVSFKAIAGGSPFNVAVGLRRLGVDAALFAGLSTDYLGRRLLQVLQDEGVRQEFLVDFVAPTTLAMVAVGPMARRSTASVAKAARIDNCNRSTCRHSGLRYAACISARFPWWYSRLPTPYWHWCAGKAANA